ncbi:MAG: hypothetical protein ACYC7H_05945, partial [Chloroflexota bacterium]
MAGPMGEHELRELFAVVARGGTLAEARTRLPDRDRKTVCRAYSVVKALHGCNAVPLRDEDVQSMVEAVGYGTTAHYIWDVSRIYQAWYRETRSKGDSLRRQVRAGRLLQHLEAVREDASRLRQHLPFWPSWTLGGLNLATGIVANPCGDPPPIEWVVDQNGCILRQLDKELGPVIQHMTTWNKRGEIVGLLANWQKVGGEGVQRCHQLWLKILEDAERETGLRTLFTSSVGRPEPGLWDGFARSIYMLVLRGVSGYAYATSSQT